MKKLNKKNIEDIFALTPMQEGMLFHYLKDPESDHYFEQLDLNITGEVNLEGYKKAWDYVVQVNEMLRTFFRWEKLDSPAQVVLKQHNPHLGFFDLSDIEDHAKQQKQLEKIKLEDRKEKFDLRQVPFRVILCKISNKDYHIIISNHHILYDGWSTGIILKEFFKAYHQLCKGEHWIKPSIKPPFKEFIKWIQNQDRNKQEQFWREYLDGFDTAAMLPLKKRRRAEGKRVESYSLILEEDIKDKLEVFVTINRVTLASVFYCAWGILLQKYCSSDDVIFGTTVAGRSASIKGIEDMVGLFINTIPLRVHASPNEKISALLFRIDRIMQEREQFDHTPLLDIRSYSAVEGGGSLFDTIVAIENYPLDSRLLPGDSLLSVDSYSIVEMTHYDLTVGIVMFNEIEVKFSYQRELLDKEAISNLAWHFKGMVQNVVENTNEEVYQLEIISRAEKSWILYDFNSTEAEFPEEKTIHQLFAEQVERTPDHTALTRQIPNPKSQIPNKEASSRQILNAFGGVHLSYRKLNEQSHQLAHDLRERGVNPDTIVAIMMERSIEMIIGLLGILKAGGAYLPIDPDYPKERIRYILADSQTNVLVNTRPLAEEGEKVRKWEGEKISFEPDYCPGRGEVSSPAPNQADSNLQSATAFSSFSTLTSTSTCQVSSANLAYIIYTSGTTGKPKGVMISHQSAVNYIWWAAQNYVQKEPVNFPLFTSLSFDLTVTSIFIPLITGNAVVMYNQWDMENLIERIIHEDRVGVIKLTPAHLSLIRNKKINNKPWTFNIKRFVVGGEQLETRIAREISENFNGDIEIYNEYGPTEATVGCMIYKYNIKRDKGISVPIGVPAANTRVYLLDKNQKLLPIGIPGEIYISGTGVALGYVNRPELTAEKFIVQVTGAGERCRWKNKSFCKGPWGSFFKKSPLAAGGKKIYKTGDLARWLPDGHMEFLGRIDHQVKIRGFRIEPGEIENRLVSHRNVKEAVAVAKETEGGDKYLCAYIIPAVSLEIAPLVGQLREYLSRTLPDYMIPAYFVTIDNIPRTPSGKIDRKMLPEPVIKSLQEYAAPRNEKEQALVDIWSEVLGIDNMPIGINDNFFELGGHSLKVAGLIGRIHKKLNIEVPFNKIFQAPTVKDLVQYLSQKEESQYCEIPPLEEKEYYPLSSAQKRIFVLQQMEVEGTAYNINGMMDVEGPVEKETFGLVFRQLISRHESLRTSFQMVEEQPVQKIHDEVAFEIEYYQVEVKVKIEEEEQTTDDRGQTKENRPGTHLSSVIRHLSSEFIRPFDLAAAPLLRVGLIKIENEKHILMVDIHHIISDGTSVDVLMNDLAVLYQGEKLPALGIQYKEFSEWQNIREEREKTKQQEAFWLKEFAGEIPILNLPTDYSRSVIPDFEGCTAGFEIPAEQVQLLKELAADTRTTLYMLLLALYYILLSKLSGQTDIVVGTPMALRHHGDLERIVGMLVNTLALRNFPSEEKSFREFLLEIKERTLDAFANQDYTYEKLVEAVVIDRDTGRNPLFDTMFVLQKLEVTAIKIPGLNCRSYEHENKTSKFDLMLMAVETNDNLLFTWEYRTKLFKVASIRKFIRYFKKIVTSATGNPGARISGIEIISGMEKARILNEFNDTDREYPREKTIQQLFEEEAVKRPDQVALVCSVAYLTWKELKWQANNLALNLRVKGINPGVVVAIMMNRSLELIVGVLGILKAGGAYMPIDPKFPGKRIRFVLKDSGVNLFITNTSTMDRFDPGIDVLNLDNLSLHNENNRNIKGINNSRNPAYVIYTSGSTGAPKGTLVEHKGVMNLLCQCERLYPLGSNGAYLLKTNYIFDVSIIEIFAWINGKGRVIILEPGKESNPGAIVNEVLRSGVTHINFVPSMLNTFLEGIDETARNHLKYLKYIFVAGEIFPTSLANKAVQLGAAIQVENIYGPTEATVYSTAYSCTGKRTKDQILIGKPLSNVQIYILDKTLHLQPIGILGELCIGGIGLARGYLNKPGLTAEKFIKIVIKKKMPGKRIPNKHMSYMSHMSYIYKTGDLARWLADGNIEFVGRKDNQVKIRGYRVELGEIETTLLKHKQIKEVVVIARKDLRGDIYLCAYIVSETDIEVPVLKNYLSGIIPAYMIPSYIQRLEKLPLTAGGKIDRKALPEPEIKVEHKYKAPENHLEEKLVEIWSNILGIESHKIGVNSNFFELGGHSLKATAMTLNINRNLNVNVPLSEIFKNPTIRKLAQYIQNIEKGQYTAVPPVERKECYELSPPQKRLFLLDKIGNAGLVYNLPTVWIIEGLLDRQHFKKTFEALINRHESLRTSFHMEGDQPMQRVHDEVEFEIEYYDTKEVEEEQKKEDRGQRTEEKRQKTETQTDTHLSSVIRHLSSEFFRPFDLSQAPLLRVGLVNNGDNKHIFMLDIHHIITDGVSTRIFMNDFINLYKGIALAPLKIHYKDFSGWQRNRKNKEIQKQQERYWLDKFKDDVPVLNFPTDFPRPTIQSFEGNSLTFQLGRDLTRKLKGLTEKTGTTLNMALVAVLDILISKYSGQEEVVVAIGIAGRTHSDFEHMIGFFVNSLVIRSQPGGNKSFQQFLEEVKKNTLEAYKNQDYPFDELVDRLNLSRDSSRNPLFDILFTQEDIDDQELEINGLKFTPYEFINKTSHVDLVLYTFDELETVKMVLEYSTALFKPSTAENIARRYIEILSQVAANQEIKLKDIEISIKLKDAKLNKQHEDYCDFNF